jgi:hypothetical protein
MTKEKTTMKKWTILSAVLLSLTLWGNPVLAQDNNAAGAKPAAAAPMSDTDKKAIAKACTDQANAKSLHGKARKKFRSACKARGGKPE